MMIPMHRTSLRAIVLLLEAGWRKGKHPAHSASSIEFPLFVPSGEVFYFSCFILNNSKLVPRKTVSESEPLC